MGWGGLLCREFSEASPLLQRLDLLVQLHPGLVEEAAGDHPPSHVQLALLVQRAGAIIERGWVSMWI